jgi:CheY-like chemotaxis protein
MPKQILLVEDSITMQKVVQIAFAREDYQIVSTTSADEALARCKESRPDIVLADASLPGKTGYELSAALRAEAGLKDVPVLLLTGHFNPYDEQRGQRSGIDGYIVKPFDTQALIDKTNTLAKGRPAGAAATAPPAPVAPAPVVPAVEPKRPTPAPVKVPPTTPAVSPLEVPRSTIVGMPQVQATTAAAPARPAPPAPTNARLAGSQPGLAASPAPATASVTEGSRMPEPIRASASPSQIPQMPRPSLIPRAPVPATVLAALERIAARGAEYDAIAKLSVEAIQQIVWEVVPELAEIIIKAEVERLAKERKA